MNHVIEPFVTVIICTRNRAEQLKQVLVSACKLNIPDQLSWEFIVVDNGSSDNTADIVESFANALPIRCVREEMPGLSNARNRGVAEAKGRYICWTDDDVEIDPDWLSAYVAAFRQHPDGAVFGGKIIPRFLPPTPEWIHRFKYEWPVDGPLAYRDLGEEVISLTFEGWKTPYGANFAVRSAEQKAHLYNPQLGVSPSHKRVGEETEVIYQILKSAKGYWVPTSKINHIIPASRQTYKYIYTYNFLVGETFSFLRKNYSADNHLLAAGTPRLYNASRFNLRLRYVKAALVVSATYFFGGKRFLKNLSDFGFLSGALSFTDK